MPGKLAITQGLLVVTIIGAGLWGATQWAAAMLGERLPLGSPWFALAGWPVYHPWRLFQWWYLHDADAPWVFERAGLLAAGEPAVAARGGVLLRGACEEGHSAADRARGSSAEEGGLGVL